MDFVKNNNLKVFGSVFFVFLVLYHATVSTLFDFWTKDEFSHGFLLLIVSAYIFYRLVKEKRKYFIVTPSIFWMLCLGLMAGVWFAARITYIEKLELISLPFISMAIVLSLLGFDNGRKFLLPFVLMLFATPIFDLGNLYLQKATALLSGGALNIVGLQVLVDGILMQIPAGNFIVDTGCSGVRVLTVGTSLCLIYSYMNRFSLRGTLFVMILGAGFSFLANIIRVMIIVYVGNVTNMQSKLVYDHGDLGWIVFAIVIFLYFFMFSKFIPYIKQYSYGRRLFESDQQEVEHTNTSDVTKSRISLVLILVFIGMGPILETIVNHRNISAMHSITLPENVGVWIKAKRYSDTWKPGYQAGIPDFSVSTNYTNGVSVINITAYLFSRQKSDNEAINVNNRPYDRKTWSPVHIISYKIPENSGLPGQVEETRIRHKDVDKIIWRWYEVNGKWTGNAKVAKIYNLLGLLRGKPEITVFMLETTISTSIDMARLNLQNMLLELPKKINIY